MVTYYMRSTIPKKLESPVLSRESFHLPIQDRHLNIHEYQVWLRPLLCVSFHQVVESFFSVPDCVDREPKFLDSLDSNLLIDCA